MDRLTYRQIYEQLESAGDIPRIECESSLSVSALFNILHKKVVRNVRRYHTRMLRNASKFKQSWEQGESILEIARKNNFPPVLLASILLKEMGHKSKAVIRNPEILEDQRLMIEVIQAIDNDLFFSPKAHDLQMRQGKLGEDIIHAWLDNNNYDFLTESDLNKVHKTKTPDFLLNGHLNINGRSVKWIESKAVFADQMEHNRYHKKQYQFYEDMYGPGMVVYWYGFLDVIVPNNYIIIDYTFFAAQGYDVDGLINHSAVY